MTPNTKSEKVISMLTTTKGASLDAIMKATEWQPHTVRGFLSTVAKKHGFSIESVKNDKGDRIYRINEHPRFDNKEFELQAKAIKSWSEFFTGQPLALCQAMHKLLGNRQNRLVTGLELRKVAERCLPEGRREPLRVLQCYLPAFRRAGMLK